MFSIEKTSVISCLDYFYKIGDLGDDLFLVIGDEAGYIKILNLNSILEVSEVK
jgi:hypothetical protein